MNSDSTELRVNNFPIDVLNVMDGFAQANGLSRAEITREVMGKWAAEKKHEATLICRVAGVNPFAVDK